MSNAQVVKSQMKEEVSEECRCFLQDIHNIKNDVAQTTEYDHYDAQVLGMLMDNMNTKFKSEEHFVELHQRTEGQFTQQYPLKKGLEIFGKAGEDAVIKEVKQQHD